jgi:NhaP-type Na+/H+ or K+/H+ antiporter
MPIGWRLMGPGLGSVTIILATVFLWSVFAARLGRVGLSSAVVFVAVGFAFTQIFDVLHVPGDPELVKVIAEVTLVWMLFADASEVRLTDFRRDLMVYVRLLGVGLPLTILLGGLVAVALLGFGVWAALLVGAALAPTDAALGASVMSDPTVPSRIRRVLNVESGLNDGIATPIVLIAIAGVAADEGIGGVHGPGHALVALLVGLLVGFVVGGAGGVLTRHARRKGWLSEELAGPATLALALLAYTGALLVDGNGFVAAFVGGLVFGNTAGPGGEKEAYFVEQSADLAAVISWLIFGALAVPAIGHWFEWPVIGYALLSLTAIRMVPVALALLGTGFDRFSVAFIGWFGPRGLASVIFALLALEDLGPAAQEITATIALTVLLSVAAHGLSARPFARRFVSKS